MGRGAIRHNGHYRTLRLVFIVSRVLARLYSQRPIIALMFNCSIEKPADYAAILPAASTAWCRWYTASGGRRLAARIRAPQFRSISALPLADQQVGERPVLTGRVTRH